MFATTKNLESPPKKK
jgi:hypothetical protein